MSKLCEVCGELDHKYKCPKCHIKYCSVKCYKQHKVVSCFPKEDTKQKLKQEHKKGRARVDEELILEDNDSEDFVPKEKLSRLDESDEMKILLENPHLQTLIRHLDSSRDPEDDVNKAMQEPILLEFADVCLRVIEPERFATVPSES